MEYTILQNGRWTSGSFKHSDEYQEVIRDENGICTNIEGLRFQEEQDKVTKLLNDFDQAIFAHIQNKVKQYNEAYKLSYADVKSCKDYKDEEGYTHQAFCIDVWKWNVEVWEYVRAEQLKVFEGNRAMPSTKEDLILEVKENVPFDDAKYQLEDIEV